MAGRRCGGCCPGCRWCCLIANVVPGCRQRVLLVVLDGGCGWEVSRRVLYGVSLVVFDRGLGWEVLCWEVAWRVSGGV